MDVRYSNGKVTRLDGPFKNRIFWTINRLFSVRVSDHHLNTELFDNRTKDYLTTGQKLDTKIITE